MVPNTIFLNFYFYLQAKNMYSILDKFLALPNDVKEKYRSQQRKNPHGYVPQNSEQ